MNNKSCEVDDGEVRVDVLQLRCHQHELRTQCIEVPLCWVLWNFQCVKFFLADTTRQFCCGQGGFLAGFVQELRENKGLVCETAIDEVETFLAYRRGRLVMGLFGHGG